MKTWNVFISHASEDKIEVATPLANALRRAGLQVWLDRQELRIGDSLREKIDEGLANSQFGVVILSPSFLAKGWPRRELDGLFAIEEVVGRKVILPIWHQLNKAMLATHSPILADRLAKNVADGIPAIANSIIEVVTDQGNGALVDVAPTPLRLLIDLLKREADRSAVVEFLASHPRIVHKALGTQADSGRWSVELGSVKVDFCASRKQHTTGEVVWYLVQFQPPTEAVLLHSYLSPLLMARVNELRDVRRWVGKNLREARTLLPDIGTGFTGIVVAGRRQQLSEVDQMALKHRNHELPGTEVRSYDWIVDAAVEMS